MKRDELEALGLTKEQVDKVLNMHHEELDPVQKELETTKENLAKETDKVNAHKTTIDELKDDLKKFDGVDVTALNEKIAQLEKDVQAKDTEYTQKLADREFQDLIKESIAAVNGRNPKAITALLDIDTLKESKNQKEDIAAALKILTEAEDSKMLFGEAAPTQVGTSNVPGTFTNKGNQDDDAFIRAAMGLPPRKE